jgi:hypothetical protein
MSDGIETTLGREVEHNAPDIKWYEEQNHSHAGAYTINKKHIKDFTKRELEIITCNLVGYILGFLEISE